MRSLTARLHHVQAKWRHLRAPLPGMDRRRRFIQGPYEGQGVCSRCAQIYALTATTASAEPTHFCSQTCETLALTQERAAYG